MARKRYVIIGDGAAGMSPAQKLRRADPTASIGVFSDDPHPAYYRAALTNLPARRAQGRPALGGDPDFYEAFSIRRILGAWSRSTPRARSSGTALAAPHSPTTRCSSPRARGHALLFQGAHLPGVMTPASLQDARKVVDYLRLGGLKNAVVLGSGALGLRGAHALLEHGVKATLLERAPRILPAALDEVASDLLAARLRNAGIETILGDEVAAAPGPTGCGLGGHAQERAGHPLRARGRGARRRSQRGVPRRPRRRAVRARRGEVDRQLRTSVPNVFAAGDVASVEGEQLPAGSRLDTRVASPGKT